MTTPMWFFILRLAFGATHPDVEVRVSGFVDQAQCENVLGHTAATEDRAGVRVGVDTQTLKCRQESGR